MNGANAAVVALSVSDGPDLARFGYLQSHLRQVLSELLITLLRADLRVGYGGDLRPDGYTRQLFESLTAAYDRNQLCPATRPAIVHYFAFSSWRNADDDKLLQHLRTLGKVAETRFIDARGAYEAVFRTNDGLRVVLSDGETTRITDGDLTDRLARLREANHGAGTADTLTAMRRTMADETVLRVVASGKVAGYQGRMPGIVEEALLHAEAGRLVVPLGAFGGASRDVAIALGLLPRDARVFHAEIGECYEESLEELRGQAEKHRDLVMRTQIGGILEALVLADDPTFIAAGVLSAARTAMEQARKPRLGRGSASPWP